MNTYVALLRGINVGGNKKVEMARLRAVFEQLGCKNVSSYINSGNIIFSCTQSQIKKLTPSLDSLLLKEFGFEIRTVIRDRQNIQKLAQEIPPEWKNDGVQKTDVLFLWDEYANEKSLKLLSINPDFDSLKYIDGSIVWNLEVRHYSQSGMGKLIGTVLYKHMTARNVNTVRKLAQLMK